MRTDTKATRTKIIATAERLFAERGIDAVSLNEINTAAEQKNKSGLHYHFGSKAGLIQAIIDKHGPGIAEARHEMLDEMESAGQLTIPNIVRCFVLPIAEKLHDPDGGVSYIRVNAQLVGSSDYNLFNLRKEYTDPKQDRLMSTMMKVVPSLPEPLRMPRMLMVTSLLFHGLANYSRIVEGDEEAMRMENTMVFTQSLVDAVVALLSVEPSPATLEAIANNSQSTSVIGMSTLAMNTEDLGIQ